MKKMVLIMVAGITIVSSIVLVLFFYANNSNLTKDNSDNQVEKIAEEYNQLREQIARGSEMTEGEQEDKSAHGYAELFAKIADGAADREKEYAQLLREFTQHTIEFGDNEVFVVADDLAKIYSLMAEGSDDFGVQEIKVAEDSSKELSLIIDYIDLRAYSVRMMDKDEMEYTGEHLVEYDGSLGKHRIEIIFYDARASAKFSQQYPIWDDHELKDVPADLGFKLNIKGVYTPDHAFVIYVGSDEPLSISEQDFTSLNRPMGSIELILKR